MDRTTARDWAYEEFGHAELGDRRRTSRLVRMLAAIAERPAGKVVEVFRSSAERQGAYDLLNNDAVRPDALLASIQQATAMRSSEEPFVYVVVDGTSLRLTDRQLTKDFGAVGSTANAARGLKLVHSYAISPRGVPTGIVDQQWWVRHPRKKRNDCQRRALQDKETIHWVRSIEQATKALDGQRIWFQIDREGDRYWTLKALHDSGQWFTVRSTYGHRFVFTGTSRRQRRLHKVARTAPVRFVCAVAVHAKPGRQGRLAKLEVRAVPMTLDMIEPLTKEQQAIAGHVVDIREVGSVPKSEKPLHWRLLTNRPIATDDDVMEVVVGYTRRWRIEELHRVWKSGACRVEESQLRSARRMTKWAILMVVTAARIERLRAFAKADPMKSSSVELSKYELRALVLLKRKYAKKTELIADDTPTIEQAVRWLADLGGYTGKSSGGPPGAVTLRRGLEFIAPAAIALELLERERKMR